ncbi:MAG TPA: RNA methyltransferase [Patescibacteria group bacterium]|nr:RNA methyltransferase [Patescibacteria group bacterium]
MKDSQIMIIGRNMVHDALKSDKTIQTIFIGKNSRNDPRIEDIVKLARQKNVELSFVTPEKIRSMSGSEETQNVIAYMQKFEGTSLREVLENKIRSGKDPLILLFNQMDYEQNLGAVIRSAWGAGVDTIVLSPNGVHEVTPVVAKVSQGGAAYVPVFSLSLFQAIKIIKDFAIPVVGVEVNMGKSYDEITLLGPVAFLLGGEVAGISKPLEKECDIFINIPINNELASLNVSVATALIIYEKRRQERRAAKITSEQQ